MFGLFKQKTIVDNEKDFEQQYGIVKVALYKYLGAVIKENAEKANIDLEGKEKLLGAGIISYLTGHDVNEWAQRVQDSEKIYAQQFIPAIKKQAEAFMAADKSIRELIVYTLRMISVFRDYHIGVAENMKSEEGQRIYALLQQYGGEFPKEVSPKLYDKLARKIMLDDIYRDNKRKILEEKDRIRKGTNKI